MTKSVRYITSTIAVILGLALLALAGAWRLGLLPLLFPPPVPAVPFHTAEQDNNPAPGGEHRQTQQPSDNNNTGGAPEGSAPSTTDQPRQQIESYYIARLRNLTGGYEGRLNGLVGEAFNEYRSAKKQGRKISVPAMAGKYISQGTALEKQCDAQFYQSLDEFKAELQRNNLPLDTAIRAQQEYEYAKASRKREILAAAARAI